MAITLVIADDHPIILDALESLFAIEPDIKIAAKCRDGEQSLAAVRKHRPDILLLDLQMPRLNAFDVMREIQNDNLNTRVVLLTAGMQDHEALTATRLGVWGVVLKEMSPKLLVQCIRKVHAGEKWLEKNSFSKALEKIVRREAGAERIAGILSRRELEIVRLLADGYQNQQIGKKLYISEGTVKVHLHHIFTKLNVRNRLHLAIMAREQEFV